MPALEALHIENTDFVDSSGRKVILRGVNLGGDVKLPYPDGGTHIKTDFANHRQVSFVNRPFPLGEAKEHFSRLRHWGFNVLRLLTSWEAVSHAGPGQFDQEYIDYYTELCRLAGEYGFYVFVDFHQDVFSRMTGGDGAPGWVLEAVGFDLDAIGPSDAALVMQHAYDFDSPQALQPENYPLMAWSRNYHYPANGILWTLFFGGRDFAPDFVVEGQNIQDYLQGHYFAAQHAIAERLVDMPHVIGFDTLNEPGMGFIGLGMHERRGIDRPNELGLPGLSWSPLQALYAMDGHRVEIPLNEISYLKGGCIEKRIVSANKPARRLWRDAAEDPFARDGAWCLDEKGQPVALHPDYFKRSKGREIEFDRDYLRPFVHAVSEHLHDLRPDWMIFFEKDGNSAFNEPGFPEGMPDKTVYAPHWYDLVTLMLKRFNSMVTYDAVKARPVFGAKGMLQMYVEHMGRLTQSASWAEQQVPTLIGEFGIPYDMHAGASYAAWKKGERGDKVWSSQMSALDMTYDALDKLMVSSTHWNYTATNSNDPRIGDGWNQEDLSIFSRDQQQHPEDIDSGGRALAGFVRPYVRRVQGRLMQMHFSRKTGLFQMEFIADADILAPCEIFVPKLQYPNGYLLQYGDSDVEVQEDPEAQRVLIQARQSGSVHVYIRRR